MNTRDPGDKARPSGDSSSDDAQSESRVRDNEFDGDEVDDDDEVDEAGRESFPASDPPAWNARG